MPGDRRVIVRVTSRLPAWAKLPPPNRSSRRPSDPATSRRSLP